MGWGVVYYETTDEVVPAREFLLGCPKNIRASILATLEAVRAAPPPAFSGGGKWEAMKGDMAGFYEVRETGPGREQFRLFCILDNADEKGLEKRGFAVPQIAVIDGMRKPIRTVFKTKDYRKVRERGDDDRATFPRRIAK